MAFKEISIEELDINPFSYIGDKWMLITAGNQSKVNTMTASWGGLGVLWNQPVATAYIRPQRYTKEFVDQEKCFSLSFFDDHKKELGYLGRVSGRDEDKISKMNLHTTFLDNVPTFEEASLVLIVEKLYEDKIKEESFLNKDLINKNYPQKDFHTVYIGKIKKVYIKD